jgi:DNA-binding XRE family transcriptional regulator
LDRSSAETLQVEEVWVPRSNEHTIGRAAARASLPVTPPTLADVAEQAGVSTQYLSEVERGRKEPSSEVLGAVAGALGLRLLDLTTRVSQQLGRMSGPLCLAA